MSKKRAKKGLRTINWKRDVIGTAIKKLGRISQKRGEERKGKDNKILVLFY